ncbi:ferredoxin [Nonomuraea sp. CA-143628]|uniref:ferredoxin n=1 Tax=Nonomuraea sp. CA-143628 TaxID=3239997 RepID=UPI003D8B1437
MKYTVDGSLCSGHGRCYMLAPEVYESDDDGINIHLDEPAEVPAGREAAARTGAHGCPERAITLHA